MNRVLKNPNNVIFYFRNIFGSTIDLKKEKSRTVRYFHVKMMKFNF